MPATCPHCGEAIDDGATTCPHCGREIAAAPIELASASPSAPQPAPPAMPVAPSAPPQTGGGLAVAALVIGIVAIVLSFTIVFGFVLGGLAIVFGAIAIARARTPGTGGKGMGVAGLVLGIVAIFFAVLTIVFVVNLGHAVNDNFSNIQFCIDHPHNPSCRDPRVP
jgi:uncharacterized protein DUF4190/zinc ribbon protein